MGRSAGSVRPPIASAGDTSAGGIERGSSCALQRLQRVEEILEVISRDGERVRLDRIEACTDSGVEQQHLAHARRRRCARAEHPEHLRSCVLGAAYAGGRRRAVCSRDSVWGVDLEHGSGLSADETSLESDRTDSVRRREPEPDAQLEDAAATRRCLHERREHRVCSCQPGNTA